MKRKLFLLLALMLTSISTWAQLTDGTVYWIQDASTGQFISQGDNWSTRAVTKDVGGLGWEAVYISEGVYQLRNIMWQTVRGEDKGLGSDLYVDNGTKAQFTLTASGDGYKVSLNGNYWINNGTENDYKEKPLGTTTDAAAASVWKFLTKAEYDAAIQAYKDAKAAAYAASIGYTVSSVSELETLISDENQFAHKDYTNSITNASLSSSGDGWTHGEVSQRNEGWNVGSGCAEFWNGCGYCKQTVSSGLPNGLYKITFVGSYRPGNLDQGKSLVSEKASSPAFVYANDAKVELLHWIDVPAKANGRDGITVANGYQNSLYTYVTDGSLNLGVVADGFTDCQTWTTFGQFTLTYYTDQVSEADATAILAEATTLESKQMYVNVRGALTNAKNTFDGNRTIANYNLLNTAISNANASIANYAALLTAITNAINHVDYTPVFSASETIYNNAIPVAQAVYDAEEVEDCSAAITALTNAIHSAYESDYGKFDDDYAYDYSTLLSQDLTQWANSDYVVMTANEHWNGQNGQRYYEQSGAEWGASSWSHAASETAILPAGHYVMSITARASADVNSTMSVKVGDNAPLVVSLAHKGSSGRGVMTDGTGSYQNGTYANNNNGRGWEYRFIAFDVAEESSVTISINSSTNAQYNWVSIAAPLLKGDVNPNQIKVNQIHSLAATLKGYEGQISAETYATFADDLAAAAAVTVESTNLDELITALQNDIAVAQSEAQAFARGAAMNALISGDNSVVLTNEATRENWTPNPELNTWSTEADNTGMVTPFLQNWLSAGNTLPDNSLTYLPIRGVQKGYYEVSALVRIYAENGDAPSAESATFTVNGTSANLMDGTSFEYNNMKGVYQTVSVRMEIEDALNIGLAYSGVNFNWISWKDLKVTYLFDPATAADYAALNEAINAVSSNVAGFEAGEYAPYNNIEAFAALAAAKAIDQTAINPRPIVLAATTALTGATWTANTEEVNAVYDGDFAIQPEHTTGPTALVGWNAVEGIRQLIKNTETDPGLNYASAKAGVFSWGGTTMTYGSTDGYEMPLAAHTIYELTFKVAGWRDGDLPTWIGASVLKGEEGMANMDVLTSEVTKRINDSEGNPFVTCSVLFVTGEAGNYVLAINPNKHNVITDITLFKAASQTLTFADNAAMPTYAPGTYPRVEVTRALTAGENVWNTLVLPFDYTAADWNVQQFKASEGDNLTFESVASGEMIAGTPYLVKPNENVTSIVAEDVEVVSTSSDPEGVTYGDFTFKPVYAQSTIVGNGKNYFLAAGTNKLYCAKADIAIKGFRAYFIDNTTSEAREVLINFDGETAINAVEAAEEGEALKDGKYLIDGQIVIVKNGVKYSANGQILK